MNLNNENPIPHPSAPKRKSLGDMIKDLPPQQLLPQLQIDSEAFEEVHKYAISVGIKIGNEPATTIAIGGEILDTDKLHEGRIGIHRDTVVVAFLYQFPTKSLRAIIIYPCRKSLDIRKVGLSIASRRAIDIPSDLVQTEIVDSHSFFKICSFDLSKHIDVPALEKYKLEFRKEFDLRETKLTRENSSLHQEIANIRKLLNDKFIEYDDLKNANISIYNRGTYWQLTALTAITFAVPALLWVLKG